jgi:hypothetical protein
MGKTVSLRRSRFLAKLRDQVVAQVAKPLTTKATKAHEGNI